VIKTVSEHAAKLEAARKLVERGRSSVIPAGRESYRDLTIQTSFYAEFLRSRRLLAQAFEDLSERRFGAMRRKLVEVKAIDRDLVRLGLSKPNIVDDFEMEGMKTWVNLKPAVDKETEEIDALLKPANLKAIENTWLVHGTPAQIDVLGQVGAMRAVRFELPKNKKKFSEVSLKFTACDLDGTHPGDEGVMRIGAREWLLAPTGDGQEKENTIVLDPAEWSDAKSLEVQFILKARPGGTLGYFVSGATLEMKGK
jgi:hypothetical protein